MRDFVATALLLAAGTLASLALAGAVMGALVWAATFAMAVVQ